MKSRVQQGIDVIPGVSGGDPCIAGTRIAVWTLEQARRLGASDAELLRSYRQLSAEDLANAWAYVRAHRDQIDAQILDNESAHVQRTVGAAQHVDKPHADDDAIVRRAMEVDGSWLALRLTRRTPTACRSFAHPSTSLGMTLSLSKGQGILPGDGLP